MYLSLIAILCPSLPIILNGTINYSTDDGPNYVLQTTATYSCDEGFFLNVTENTRTCQDDDDDDDEGAWSDEAPTCVRELHNNTVANVQVYMRPCIGSNFIMIMHAGIICPSLEKDQDITVNFQDPPYYGTQAMYETNCPTGQERRGGDDVITCTGDGSSATGVWSGTAPICASM